MNQQSLLPSVDNNDSSIVDLNESTYRENITRHAKCAAIQLAHSTMNLADSLLSMNSLT